MLLHWLFWISLWEFYIRSVFGTGRKDFPIRFCACFIGHLERFSCDLYYLYG